MSKFTACLLDPAAATIRPVIMPELAALGPAAPGELAGAIITSTRIGGLPLALDRPVLTVTVAEAS